MGLITAAKLLLKSKSMGAIKSVAPFSKTGGKTVEQWKSKISQKKLTDAIKAAGEEVTGKLNKTAKELEKLTTTLKKQKKILDD